MTNFEHVKAMDIEELAKFLSDIQWDSSEPTTQEMFEWLIEEYKPVSIITEDMYCSQPFLSQAGQWICTESGNYIFFDKTTDKVWRATEITDEVVFEKGD